MNMNNWQGLFEWSVRQQDGTAAPSELPQRSQEELAWLREALEDATKDPADRLKDLLKVLQSEAASAEQKDVALDEILELVEMIDFANDFHTIGGFPVILNILKQDLQQSQSQESSPLLLPQSKAAEVIAVCVQNNQKLKQLAFQEGVLSVLINSIENLDDAQLHVKVLLAISSLIRNFPVAQVKFAEDGGILKLMRFIKQGDQPKLVRRSLSLLSHVLSSDESSLEYLQRQDVDCIIEALKIDNFDIHEAALQLLLLILRKNGERLVDQLKLEKSIKELQQMISDGGQEKEEIEQESLEMCKTILQELQLEK